MEIASGFDANGLLKCKVYENLENKDIKCDYDRISYSFFRNNKLLCEKDEFYLSIDDLLDSNDAHGVFRVVAHIRNPENQIV